MDTGSIVIVSLTAPKEKIWGQLLTLQPAGVTVRGVDIDSFDEFVSQVGHQREVGVGLSTVFYPMQRVERIALDESLGSIPSHSDRFHEKVGLTVQEYLAMRPLSG